MVQGGTLEDTALAIADGADIPAVLAVDTGGERLQDLLQGQKPGAYISEELIAGLTTLFLQGGHGLLPSFGRFPRVQPETLQEAIPLLRGGVEEEAIGIRPQEPDLHVRRPFRGGVLADLAAGSEGWGPFRRTAGVTHGSEEGLSVPGGVLFDPVLELRRLEGP
jgi:hypothetical protein